MGLEAHAIRTCVREWLVEAQTLAGSRVKDTPTVPHRPDVDPGIVLFVFTLDEDPTTFTDSPRVYSTELELAVEAYVPEDVSSSIGTAPERADRLDTEVFRAIEARLLELDGVEIDGCPNLSIDPEKTRYLRKETEFDYRRNREIAGTWRMTWAIVYARDRPLPDPPALESVGVRWDVAPPDGTPELTSEIEPSTP